MPRALPLRPGDPLPELVVSPRFELTSFAGGWLLLLSVDDIHVAVALHAALAEAGVRVQLCALLRGAPQEVGGSAFTVLSDADLRAADGLGALADGGVRADLVTLIDPRGTVQQAFVHDDVQGTVTRVASCLGVGR